MLMRVLDALAELRRDLQSARQRHLLGPRESPLEVFTREVFHREIRPPFVLSQVVDRDDVLVGELRGGARFAEEALAHLGVVHVGCGYELQRDDPLQDGIVRAVHDAHAAVSELLVKLIPPEGFHRVSPSPPAS